MTSSMLEADLVAYLSPTIKLPSQQKVQTARVADNEHIPLFFLQLNCQFVSETRSPLHE